LTTLANAKVKTNETFIVQVSLTIVTYDRQNIFIVQATGEKYLESIPFVFAPALLANIRLG
jgi:hypothetical protein